MSYAHHLHYYYVHLCTVPSLFIDLEIYTISYLFFQILYIFDIYQKIEIFAIYSNKF